MNALQFLRAMHADTKFRLKVILGSQDPNEALPLWQALEPMLDLHERLEDDLVYTPLTEEMGPGTALGDWADRHDADVLVVKQLIATLDSLEAGSDAWRTTLGSITDTLNKHVTDEEGQIFGRIEQAWDVKRLEAIGAEMEKRKNAAGSGAKRRTSSAKPAVASTARRRR